VKFIGCPLSGAYLVAPESAQDERGLFARTYCRTEFAAQGLNPSVVQCNTSYNRRRGTLRGMHYQKAPFLEAKLVRCTYGAIYDVIIDLRQSSPTYKNWFGVELTRENRLSMYVPEGFAHGFITLVDHSEVLYQMSEFFQADYAAGVRWDDPAFSIAWPIDVRVISDRDRSYPNL
jgi:dTDP-4-dehydrorhamnose 3,5-epimerase